MMYISDCEGSFVLFYGACMKGPCTHVPSDLPGRKEYFLDLLPVYLPSTYFFVVTFVTVHKAESAQKKNLFAMQ